MAQLKDAGFFVSLPTGIREPKPQREITFSRPEADPVHVELEFRTADDKRGVERHRLMLDRIKSNSGAYTRPWLTSARTACNRPITGYYRPLDESYEGVLCTKCFTEDEIVTAADMRVAEAERVREEAERWTRERAEHSRQLEAERIERTRRAKTGETEPIEKPEPEEDR